MIPTLVHLAYHSHCIAISDSSIALKPSQPFGACSIDECKLLLQTDLIETHVVDLHIVTIAFRHDDLAIITNLVERFLPGTCMGQEHRQAMWHIRMFGLMQLPPYEEQRSHGEESCPQMDFHMPLDTSDYWIVPALQCMELKPKGRVISIGMAVSPDRRASHEQMERGSCAASTLRMLLE